MLASFFITWIATTVSVLILANLPTGIEADTVGRAGVAALVFGLLNAPTSWLINNGWLNLFTLGLLGLIGNTILFGLAALLVKGFRLKWGLVSAMMGAIGIALMNSLFLAILRPVFGVAV